MNIDGLGSVAYNQKFETPAERSSGQTVRQQAPSPQEPPEDTVRSASMRNPETVQQTEGMESKSIDLYA